MKRVALLGLLLVSLVPAHAERRIALDAELRVDARAADALDAADAFGDALGSGDLAAAKALLSEDVVVLESGGVEASREQYFAHHAAADVKFLAERTQTIKRRFARGDGRSAWIATESEIRRGSEPALASTETLVLEKRKGDWKIVQIHWSSR